jgi:hypothetical protein
VQLFPFLVLPPLIKPPVSLSGDPEATHQPSSFRENQCGPVHTLAPVSALPCQAAPLLTLVNAIAFLLKALDLD